jgi:hypothetical protein
MRKIDLVIRRANRVNDTTLLSKFRMDRTSINGHRNGRGMHLSREYSGCYAVEHCLLPFVRRNKPDVQANRALSPLDGDDSLSEGDESDDTDFVTLDSHVSPNSKCPIS